MSNETHYTLAIKTSPTEWGRFDVPKEVYVYVKQLEACINSPQHSNLKELYPKRFHQGNWPHGKEES